MIFFFFWLYFLIMILDPYTWLSLLLLSIFLPGPDALHNEYWFAINHSFSLSKFDLYFVTIQNISTGPNNQKMQNNSLNIWKWNSSRNYQSNHLKLTIYFEIPIQDQSLLFEADGGVRMGELAVDLTKVLADL